MHAVTELPQTESQDPRGPGSLRRLSATERAIAKGMVASLTIPSFTVEAEVRMQPALGLRETLAAEGCRTSVNDLVIAAVATALVEHRTINASFEQTAIRMHERVNVGVAVSIDRGLLVPVLRNADRLTLAEIGTTTRELAELARVRKLDAPQLEGATFTVSNLGMHGIQRFSAVINPPQAAILAIGTITDRSAMALTLSCDHRVIYGAEAADFMATLRGLLEQPATLGASGDAG